MILIIGYGHAVAGEAIGFLAAQRLQQHNSERDVVVLACEQLLPELAETLSRCDLAIFLGSETCSTCEMRCAQLEPVEFIQHFAGEEMCPRHLLAIARTQWGHAPRAYEIAASPLCEESAFNERLLPEILSLVRCLIRSEKHVAAPLPLPSVSPETAMISLLT
jgi:hypothetical protein